MTLLEREREALTTTPSHDELVMRLRTIVKDELVSGTARDEVLATLDELRRREPDHENIALDVMDFVVGWSSPHASLQEPGAHVAVE